MELQLSAYTQSALAELCCAAKSLQWSLQNGKEPTPEQLEAFADVVERFDRVKWDDTYDRLHRSGANS